MRVLSVFGDSDLAAGRHQLGINSDADWAWHGLLGRSPGTPFTLDVPGMRAAKRWRGAGLEPIGLYLRPS
jgi:hypothetical protein